METPAQKVNLVSWSAIVRYAVISAINLAILLVGIAIGVMMAPHIEKTASAQNPAQSAATAGAKAVQGAAQSATCVSSATVECVTPLMTVGSAGIGKLLNNQISSDQLTVNGYDVLKLVNNLLGVMVQSKMITPAQAQALAEASHPDKYLRFQPSPQPPTPPAK
jgi:hypothetical protein